MWWEHEDNDPHVTFQSHALVGGGSVGGVGGAGALGGVGGVGGVLVNGSGLGSLSLSLSLAPPGTPPPSPLTQHTLDHIKVT